MIPTIEDIVRGVKDGSIGFNQACRWLEEHIEMARACAPRGADDEERRMFAAMAMQGLLARGQSFSIQSPKDAAPDAVEAADALIAALK